MSIDKLEKQKKIALVAHDNRKEALISWAEENKDVLCKHFLCGTGTTAKLITERTGLQVNGFKSGPMGGDQQIGANIVEGNIDFMIFFWDPLTSQPHDPDVKALLRISVLYDIPIAMSKSTADFILKSPIMEEEYERHVIDYYNKIRKNNF
ncbi:methylglyoxal synthase [Clostridium pasteurianum DSM 525 = ATCC 6013]|uniref:Methylglyoxal synthase n=1 Tax=Clostridium pasteurianum DSM 525 = ATCC 6013 TaxID=1262449 RepID=A0A0H3J273_CLOPA|nr:methylglyoxal synthase [Clostridium pasteurianum]AJA47524.1 methylglyoxal synthase [Clostridium pasteurianum DSM 525 = ATCC 6013]AJA51512.1 methylglyoxal synthase [Clostridium pasteurianum DSM 525 = ATCC 6013]AOZ74842.1 methylglyoxal synthase [Clostridium pasteurianum DSM 525 = ATCC 6013]AOZ78638.1 methylglyoxal synthase [Clostridium pasteurianum]ELP57640.1 methylglyoxal synthase [Clostridium pasteurianum DSM 525 = ATCC 6013]